MSFLSLIWPFDLIWVVFLGLCLGSFSTAVTYRELHDLSWLLPLKKGQKQDLAVHRSACPSCHHPLGVLDLVPVFSWLCLRGRCRYCSAPIGFLYPALELICLLSCLIIYGVHGLSYGSFLMMLCVPFLLALIVVDFKRMILSNLLVGCVAVLGFVWALGRYGLGQHSLHDVLMHLFGGLLYGGFFLLMGWVVSKVLRKDALGGGDVKFVAAAGIWLGPVLFSPYCILSGILGVLIGAVWTFFTRSSAFPFGPALIIALYVLWLFDSSFFLEIM